MILFISEKAENVGKGEKMLVTTFFPFPPMFLKSVLLNLLPDNKILDWSKFRQIAGNISKCI